jgi:hypothetical protein
MERLTVYKNLDARQPVSISADSRGDVLSALRCWILEHEGDVEGSPACADGLTIFLSEDRRGFNDVVCLGYDELYEEWEVHCPSCQELYKDLPDATEDFLMHANVFGEWSSCEDE